MTALVRNTRQPTSANSAEFEIFSPKLFLVNLPVPFLAILVLLVMEWWRYFQQRTFGPRGGCSLKCQEPSFDDYRSPT